MKTRPFALIAGVVLTLTLVPAFAAWNGGYGMAILVDGSQRQEYSSGGTTYIEALRGREYSIRITNPLSCRVAVALAVDGLNTIDAKHTDAKEARKWVLDPYESVVISGWQINGSEARRFYFTGERSSYGNILGQTDNLGVIEAVFFRELPPVRPVPVEAQPQYDSRSRSDAPSGSSGGAEGGVFGGVLGGAPPPPSPTPAPESKRSTEKAAPSLSDDYAATGIGQKQRHDITWVTMRLEDRPSAVVRIRYEFRPQLVRLGILPDCRRPDPLRRRESSSGFEQAYCPDPYNR